MTWILLAVFVIIVVDVLWMATLFYASDARDRRLGYK